MRSAAEVTFRVRQELSNLYLAAAKPQLTGEIPLDQLPLPAPDSVVVALRGTIFEFTVLATAQNILAHRFPLLGLTLETGPNIEWRRDYVNQMTSGPAYFRRVNYLSFEAIGDHKFIWELSRHQHLVLLAQAHLFTGKAEYLSEIFAELESWLEQNPFLHGVNWTSALEVAFRALSWIWLWHFCRESMPPELRRRFLTSLYQHGRYLLANLSVYFSANTHLLGEAVALHALGVLFPTFPHAGLWKRRGAQVVEEQLAAQIRPDGSHFEQSTYYHVYAVDFFVLYYLLAGKPAHLEPSLIRMAEYLHWLLGPARRIAYFGDDDGGRLFYPQGKRDEFGRATLATCGFLFNREEWIGTREDLAAQAAWLLPSNVLSHARATSGTPKASKHFPDSGAIFLQSKELYIQFDAGPLGWAGAGHSHADTLSFVVWRDNELVLTDPGTFTYLGNPVERERFRATASHNTITINGLSQADPAGPFRWTNKPSVELHSFVPAENGGVIDASCEYRGFTHRRRLSLDQGRIIVLDEISGPSGEHQVEQLWNLGPAAGQVHFSFSEPAEEIAAEISPSYGLKVAARAIIVKRQGSLPISLAMSLDTRQITTVDVALARQMFNNEVSNSRTSS
jgi:hypothetical protein